MISKIIKLAERGFLTDSILRAGIVRLCKNRLDNENNTKKEDFDFKKNEWIDTMNTSPIALVPEKANEQHYEVPPSFFKATLGSNLKYSSGYWPKSDMSLDESEESMLEICINRADLIDGQNILELGCGWGSLTIYMATKFPNSKITAISNSNDQRKYIQKQCQLNNIRNINVITSDMNDFQTEEMFDRVLSVEMFEHMRNYKELLSRIDSWLYQEGKLFIHIFSHKSLVYPFENNNEADWMAREFFSGGMMPSHDLLLYFQENLTVDKTWRMSGTHYEKTSRAWLKKMDNNKKEVLEIFSKTYSEKNAALWFQRWRIFFMSCEKLFGFKNGTEWGISHYRFLKR